MTSLLLSTSTSKATTVKAQGRGRSNSLPTPVVEYLKAWLMEHMHHPYPTDQEKAEMVVATGIDVKRLNNWFVNNRIRYWKPRMEALQRQQQQQQQQQPPPSSSSFLLQQAPRGPYSSLLLSSRSSSNMIANGSIKDLAGSALQMDVATLSSSASSSSASSSSAASSTSSSLSSRNPPKDDDSLEHVTPKKERLAHVKTSSSSLSSSPLPSPPPPSPTRCNGGATIVSDASNFADEEGDWSDAGSVRSSKDDPSLSLRTQPLQCTQRTVEGAGTAAALVTPTPKRMSRKRTWRMSEGAPMVPETTSTMPCHHPRSKFGRHDETSWRDACISAAASSSTSSSNSNNETLTRDSSLPTLDEAALLFGFATGATTYEDRSYN